MKKLLVLLVSAALVLSMAAVSMAAVNVSADWRAEWVSQDSEDDGDFGFKKYDLRFNFDGKVSDTIDAHLQIAYENTDGTGTATIDGKSGKVIVDGKNGKVIVKEYWATFKQSWGTFQAGAWDYKLYPSRVLIKPHNQNCINEKSMQFVATVPFPNGFSIGALVIPDLKDNKTDWDLKVAYKGSNWGAEVHYGQDEEKDDDYWTYDVYYQITKDIKVFSFGMNTDTDGTRGTKKWDDDFAAAIGAQWSKIAGSKLTASLEVGLETAGKGSGNDFTPVAVQLKYEFNNKLNLEVEYTNYSGITEDDVLVIRPRIKF